MNLSKKLLVDTNSSCFLCVKASCASDTDENGCRFLSFANVSRFLKIDVENLLNNHNSSEHGTELMVNVCSRCCGVSNKFDKLFQQLELIKLKLNASVVEISEVISGGDESAHQLMSCGFARKLRRETVTKCSLRIKASPPMVKLQRVSKAAGSQLLFAPPGETELEEAEGKSNNSTNDDNEDSSQFMEAPSPDDGNNEDEPMEPFVDEDDSFSSGADWRGPVKKKKPFKKVIKATTIDKLRKTPTKGESMSCQFCPETFRDRGVLRKHTLMKHRANILAGSTLLKSNMEKVTAAVDQIIHEMCSSGTKGNHGCPFCDKSYKSTTGKQDLECHLISVHFDLLKSELRERLRDEKVGTGGRNEEILDGGLLPDDRQNPFKKKSKSISKEKKTAPALQRCKICRKMLNSASIKRHMNIHSEERPLVCPYCPERFRDKGVVRKHTLIRHRANILADSIETTACGKQVEAAVGKVFQKIMCFSGKRGEHKCTFCGKFYGSSTSKMDLECHLLKVHLDVLKSRLTEMLNGENIEEEIMEAGEGNKDGDEISGALTQFDSDSMEYQNENGTTASLNDSSDESLM